MFMVGLPEGGTAWEVALEDPLAPEITLTTLRVGPGAVATSSVVKRTWKQGGQERHHLIDPRTGEPALTDWMSLTVIAAHACEAEVFAKALLIGGPTESEDIIRCIGTPLSYLAVDREKKIWSNKNSLEYAHVK